MSDRLPPPPAGFASKICLRVDPTAPAKIRHHPGQVFKTASGPSPPAPKAPVRVAVCHPDTAGGGWGARSPSIPFTSLPSRPEARASGDETLLRGVCLLWERARCNGKSHTQKQRGKKPPQYQTARTALYKCRTGKKQGKKRFVSPHLSSLSLPIAGSNYKALILSPQFAATRASPMTDQTTRTATRFAP